LPDLSPIRKLAQEPLFETSTLTSLFLAANLQFAIWGHMKTLVYETKVDSRAELRARIFSVAEQIRNHPDRIASAIQSLLIRAENCLANGGGHFEQLL
jgi:hypothetical protein